MEAIFSALHSIPSVAVKGYFYSMKKNCRLALFDENGLRFFFKKTGKLLDGKLRRGSRASSEISIQQLSR